MAEAITLDELMVALREAGVTQEQPGEGFTRRELRGIWGVGDKVCQRILEQAIEANIVRRGRRLMVNTAGITSSVPTYWFELPKPAKARKK